MANILSDAEREAAHARQQRRYRDEQALKQYQEREHLRGEIPSREIVRGIMTVQNMFLRGTETIKTHENGFIEQELDRTRIAALKAYQDAGFKLLNKTVPDLKQIELRADVSEEVLPQTITYKVVRPTPLDEIMDDEEDTGT